MPIPLIYLDTSTVREGALPELKAAIRELAEFVEANVAQLLAYSVYFSEDGTQMTVMHVHRDAASLDRHMEVAGPRFARFADLLELESIRIYGTPSPAALVALEEKARLLGGTVSVQPEHAGFVRVPV
jgi:hypothetical protein